MEGAELKCRYRFYLFNYPLTSIYISINLPDYRANQRRGGRDDANTTKETR